MKGYQVIFAIVFLSSWMWTSDIVLAQTESGTGSKTSPNTEKTLGASDDVLPPSPNPTPPAPGDTKKSLPKIEKQDIVITGEDRSKIKHEEQRVSIEKQPGSVNVPAIGVLKTETPEMLPVPKIAENQAIRPSRPSLSVSQTPIYSFSVNYGSKEFLSYDFSHSRQIKRVKDSQRFSYCFGVQRERSDGFHHGTVSSPFGCFSSDGLNGEGVVYFKDYSVRTGMSYFSHVVTLPYSGTQTNKLEKSGFADYDIKIPGGAVLTLGIDCNKSTLFKADADSASGYLKFTTPFTANTPPIALGSIISHEKVTRVGTSSYDNSYYSLYAESRYIKLSKVNLDVKVAVDGYKTMETTSQVDYLIAASYPWKPDTIFQMNLERKLFLPNAGESYVHEDYTGINSMLKPQSGTKIRLGGNWCMSQDVSLGATIFSENISDYISWGTATDMLYQPTNIGDVKLSGIELRLQHNLTKKLVQSISFISTNQKNKSDSNKVVPYIPNARLIIGLKYADSKNLSVSLDGEYIGERYALPDNKDKKLDSYFLVNLTANKQVNDTLSCTFDWENLLDEDYEIRDGYYGNPTIIKVGLELKI
ncbi:TonB-dependent receptor [Candidatus Desantisbacteria bacterium]|nr:TonB-dependent receptor [Candidatus Desantisbacteria bacterium]